MVTKSLESRILEIRGEQVMVDRDLAEVYGVPTKRLNEQFKRTPRSFPATSLLCVRRRDLRAQSRSGGAVYADGIAASQRNWGVERRYLRGANEVPWGLLVRLFRPGETVPPIPDWPTYRNGPPSPEDSQRTRFNLEPYGRMREARARYLSPG